MDTLNINSTHYFHLNYNGIRFLMGYISTLTLCMLSHVCNPLSWLLSTSLNMSCFGFDILLGSHNYRNLHCILLQRIPKDTF